jgi:hypothetical protein
MCNVVYVLAHFVWVLMQHSSVLGREIFHYLGVASQIFMTPLVGFVTKLNQV